jgi:hypothetical protein
MTATIQNTAVSSTFDFWRNRTNELAYAMSTIAVTTNSNTAVGNAAITGQFTANAILISNGSTSIALNTPNSAVIASGLYGLSANGGWVYRPVSNGIVVTTGTSTQNVDSWLMSTYSTAEYVVNVKDNAANGFSATKILVVHDTGNSYITEYGTINSNGSLGTFSSTTNATHVVVRFTPASVNTTVKYARTLI